jgi:predicted DNA-binding transcriptional regulator AlpA
MDRLLLKSEDAADVLGISRTHLYQLNSTGVIGPRPIKLGKCSVWSYPELREWVIWGCPRREEWERIRAECNRHGQSGGEKDADNRN